MCAKAFSYGLFKSLIKQLLTNINLLRNCSKFYIHTKNKIIVKDWKDVDQLLLPYKLSDRDIKRFTLPTVSP